MTGALALNNDRVTGLVGPMAAQDAATKDYVDTAVRGKLEAIIFAGENNTAKTSDWFKTATIPSFLRVPKNARCDNLAKIEQSCPDD